MSRERARARAARLAARQAEVASAAQERARAARRRARRERLRPRLPAVPTPVLRTVLVLAGVELLASLLTPSLRVRLGIAVVTLAVLFVYVVSARRSSPR